MKKSVILAILGLAAGIVSTYGAGVILLDTYESSGPLITLGHTPIDGSLGFTVGLYYAPGDVTGLITSDPAGFADPSTLGGGLVPGTGPGSTASFIPAIYGFPGTFFATTTFLCQPTGAPGAIYTFEVVAYNGADYLNSTIRGHSAPFTLATSDPGSYLPVAVGTAMQGFDIGVIPEPTALALAGPGAAMLLAFGRRQQA